MCNVFDIWQFFQLVKRNDMWKISPKNASENNLFKKQPPATYQTEWTTTKYDVLGRKLWLVL